MKTCAIYVRKSVLTKKGESINNQINMCRSYAKDNDITINSDLIYCDEGYSGKDTDRPQFKQMLNNLNKNKFDTIICYRLDRISRSINDFSNLINVLEENNITFISIRENFDTNTPMGKSMMYIASVFSELERETIRERIKDNLYGLSLSGRWLGGITPTGYRSECVVSLDNNSHKKKTYELQPISFEISLVKTLFNKFLQFNNLSKLENYCNENNFKSKNGLSFTTNSLKQILMNPVYSIADKNLYDYLSSRGYNIYNNRNEFNSEHGVISYEINGERLISLSTHEGIIGSKDWIYIQEFILNQSKIPSRQGTSAIGLLSGLVYCKICNSLMRVKYGRKTKGGISFYYLCTVKEKDNKSCNNNNLRGAYVDNMICKKVKSLFKSYELHKYLLKYITLDRDFTKENNTFNKYISEDKGTCYFENKNNIHKSELINLKDKLNILEDQLHHNKNSSSSKYILKEIKLINDKIIVVQNNISKIYNYNKDNETNNALLLNEIISFFENVITNFCISNLIFNEKQYLLNEVINHIYCHNFKITIYFK